MTDMFLNLFTKRKAKNVDLYIYFLLFLVIPTVPKQLKNPAQSQQFQLHVSTVHAQS